ncbi:ankyrin repeat domain-containing protein [Bacillus tianshenii]|uniref:ankyrin repeat domain-containing protein n=1 Tax=Sutcliffiella tianshenii TaxID=1463404 RepID=UPI001CD58F01|nr:ankyrin repeat domain-containing protein [Bacillus tianshenii]MCA1321554.1 ankyrin repeat domain-containing protein [Bacillus tianshenii]
MRVITQPDMLKTDDYLPACGGKGNDVWRLMTACMTGETRIAQKLLKENPTLVNCSWAYFTPLHLAVREGHTESVECLLQHGADATAIRGVSWQDTPLQKANDRGYSHLTELIERHIQQEAPSDSFSESLAGSSAEYNLFTASAVGDDEYVGNLLSNDSSKVNTLDPSGRSALFYASKNGHESIVQALLQSGANPNLPEKDAPGGASLHASVSANHQTIVRMLLDQGADPNAEVEASGNALYIAMRNGNQELVEELCSAGGSISLTDACALGRKDLVEEILALRPSEVNAGDFGPLTQAVSEGYIAIVHLLLKHGAELNAPWYTSNYMTYAMRFTEKEMVKMLLDKGADPNRSNWLGVSYLHIAAMLGKVDMAKLLLEYGADLEATDDEYCTIPLGWAAKYGQEEMVSFLLNHGAKPSSTIIQDWAQPVAWAERKGYAAILEKLK